MATNYYIDNFPTLFDGVGVDVFGAAALWAEEGAAESYCIDVSGLATDHVWEELLRNKPTENQAAAIGEPAQAVDVVAQASTLPSTDGYTSLQAAQDASALGPQEVLAKALEYLAEIARLRNEIDSPPPSPSLEAVNATPYIGALSMDLPCLTSASSLESSTVTTPVDEGYFPWVSGGYEMQAPPSVSANEYLVREYLILHFYSLANCVPFNRINLPLKSASARTKSTIRSLLTRSSTNSRSKHLESSRLPR